MSIETDNERIKKFLNEVLSDIENAAIVNYSIEKHSRLDFMNIVGQDFETIDEGERDIHLRIRYKTRRPPDV